ncbi:ATPase [Erythrobacter tepidarius]|uniref:F0F1 ATP synthase subunit B family protein n=1 Tax=Erythrobacter tepidarius TaxID=60454 RepID=UPI000A38F28F|nr:ATPase [Erythrobacter tepidarius]
MPQIAQLMETYASQIFWLLVFFGAVYFIVGRGMVPKVMATVAQRDDQIAADLAAAQAARDAADAEEAAWRARENASHAAAQEILAKAKAEAAKASEAKLAAAQARIEARLAEAEAAIAATRTAALAEIEDVAIEVAQDIVNRLAGAEVSRAQAETAVKEALHHV